MPPETLLGLRNFPRKRVHPLPLPAAAYSLEDLHDLTPTLAYGPDSGIRIPRLDTSRLLEHERRPELLTTIMLDLRVNSLRRDNQKRIELFTEP